jgi:microsomal dipeptidase-like Zn-dependent dipeptidase
MLAASVIAILACWAGTAPAEGAAPTKLTRYSLAGGCFALRSGQTGGYVAKAAQGYTASAGSIAAAEPFRMQATDLGRYLFYGPSADFMARTTSNGVAAAGEPSDDSDWTVNTDGKAFRITNEFAGRDLAVSAGGVLVTVPRGSAGPAGRFGFDAAAGCTTYPEVEVNVEGTPRRAKRATGGVSGFVETHMHHMAFEFLGTKVHCGRPWHRFGAPYALVDCDDHTASQGCGAVLENTISFGSPVGCHDPVGWPTFKDWPHHQSLTHEQSYYKWIERAWRGGLRIFVNLMVENRVLCELYPLTPRTHSCNEMDSVRLQIKRARELQDYIDAQSGGPGKGFYRIVEDPAEARRVINDGKLAVVLGMEVSEPFNCRLMQPGDMPLCSAAQVNDGIDELYELGVRQIELVNKFDNALTGVAGDSGSTGTITNGGNFLSAGTFWDLEHCDDEVNHDHSPTALPHNDDQLIANGLDQFGDFTGVTFPVYGNPPHCNQRGLTALGELAIRRLMDKGMLFDPDHMSVFARNQALDLVESQGYGGVMTSHSWSTDNALPRISALGGLIGPAAKSPQGFVADWLHMREHGYDQMNPYLFGLGYGADMNGFASQGGPPSSPISYPFQSSIDPAVTIHRQKSGERVYDYNVDGTAHYGLYADWVEAVRIIGGQEIIDDMARGAEAYLQMWERATGIR